MPDRSSAPSSAVDGGFELVNEELEQILECWARFVVCLRRLAFKRRCWGHLGRWLKVIKAGLRNAPDDRATGGRTRGAGS